MADFFDFAPDAERAARLNARMHAGLAESLEHICEQTADLAGFDHASVMAVARALRSGQKFPPAAFGRYYELAFALVADDEDSAVRASTAFAGLVPFDGTRTITSIADPLVRGDADMFRRRIGANTDDEYIDPPEQMVADFVGRLGDGLALLNRAAPKLADEVNTLIRQIVFATNGPDVNSPFDGASIYQLWGLVVLNPKFSRTPVDIVETLAHEGAHTLLFGFTYDEPLVLNDDSELFASPLRQDPRPMDGVYHATFVSARMHWAMTHLAKTRNIDTDLREMAEVYADRDRFNFFDGLKIVEDHARLTDTGRALMDNAKAYMGEA